MRVPEEPGVVYIPEGEKLVYKSELFDVVIRSKSQGEGFTRNHFYVLVELLEHDPLLERTVVLEIPEDVWHQLEIGERAKARLYEQPDKRWTTRPPAGVL